MSNNWRFSICQNCSQQDITNPNGYVLEIDDADASPIDRFYKTKNELLRLGNPEAMENSKLLSELLVIGIMSATERYFRDIFSAFISICPVARETTSGQSIAISSVLWSKKYGLKKGLFENISFADKKTVINACKTFLGYEIQKKDLAYAMLDSYEKVCQIRHCIVHAGSHWVAKNAISLGINARENEIKVDISFDNLQECIAICTNLVICFNLDLFEIMCKRWAIDWRKRSEWTAKSTCKRFNDIWEIFYSKIDSELGSIDYILTKNKCMNQVKSTYNI